MIIQHLERSQSFTKTVIRRAFSQLVNGSIKKIKSDVKRELMESGQRKNMEVNNTISQFIAAQQCWGFGESVINQNNQQAYNLCIFQS